MSTPDGDGSMIHSGVAEDATIRRENFRKLWAGKFSPSLVAATLWGSPSQWSDLYHGRKSFGEKLARDIEAKMNLVRGSLDDPSGARSNATDPGQSTKQHPLIEGAHIGAPVAHAAIHRPWTLPPLLSREAFMQAIDLPEAFTVAVPDDALAPSLTRGTEVVFKRAESAEPGQCVVVEDRERKRYIRRFTQEAGGAWGAEAINKVYLSLHSERDGLKLLAVMAWRAESRV